MPGEVVSQRRNRVEGLPVRMGGLLASLGPFTPLLLALCLTLVVQGRALRSDFCGEDMIYLFQVAVSPGEFLVSPHAGQLSATFGVVLAALHALFGLHFGWYFGLVLGTHLGHVALLYAIVRALCRSPWIAGTAAALWGAAPAFQGTLQWFSAYDHMLGVTAMLWALWELSRAAEAGRPPTPLALVRVSLVLLAGAAAVLAGSLTSLLFPAVAHLLLPEESKPRRTALWLIPAAVLSLLMVAAFVGVDLTREIHRAARVGPVFSADKVALMVTELLVYGVGVVFAGPLVTADETGAHMGLFEVASPDTPIWVSAGFFLPAVALVAVRFIRGDRAERRALLALLGLAGSIYALTAIGRAEFLPLEKVSWLATRDRYHYVATPAIVVALALCVARVWPRVPWPPRRSMAVLLGVFTAGWVTTDWLVARDIYLRGARRPEWTRDWMELADGAISWIAARTASSGTLYVRNDPFRPAMLEYSLGIPRADFPGIGAYWIIAHGLEGPGGCRIRFVEEDGPLLASIRARYPRATSALFVAPDDVVRAGAIVRTIEADAPSDVAEYLAKSVDPTFGGGDRSWAARLRQSLAEATRNPAAPWRPTPAASTATPALDPSLVRQDPKALESFKKALQEDPEAMESMRKAIREDPAAMEELRKAMQREQRQSTPPAPGAP